MTRAELLALKRDDFREFMDSWREEQHRWPDGFVPAHRLLVTGMILWELAEDGRVVGNGFGWRPA